MFEWLGANWLALLAIAIGLANFWVIALHNYRAWQFAVASTEAVQEIAKTCAILTEKVNEVVDLVNEPVKVTIDLQEVKTPATNVKPAKGMN